MYMINKGEGNRNVAYFIFNINTYNKLLVAVGCLGSMPEMVNNMLRPWKKSLALFLLASLEG